MIEIATIKGEIYSYDPDTLRIFCDGKLLSSAKVEPVYSLNDKTDFPDFAGILLKDTGNILSRSGKINKITDINAIK